MAESLREYQSTVWGEFTPLAIKHNAVNLGQGFPAFPAPQFIKDALCEGTQADHNQYTRIMGFLPLVNEVARVYSRKHSRTIDPLTEVLVTFGASEALSLSFLGLLNPGDEVVLFDPSFDLYFPEAALAHAVVKAVPMLPPQPGESVWQVDWAVLEASFTSRTRLIVLNTPNNPLGKVFTDAEMQRLAGILAQWPEVSIISDEVYEHLTYEGRKLCSIADYGDLWERTGTLGSAGKIFSVTGWKTGWVVGGAKLVQKLTLVKQWTTYTSNTACQYAVAKSFQVAELPYEGFPTYYAWLQHEYDRKRVVLMDILATSSIVEFEAIPPEGGFFVIARIKSAKGVDPKYFEGATPDYAVARWLTVEHRVGVIPCSSFFTKANKHMGEQFVRFALCKRDEDYALARERLQCGTNTS